MEALRWPQAHSTNGLQTHWIKHGSVGGRKKSSLISLKPNFESTLFHGLIASAASKQQQQQPHKPKPDSSSSSKRKKSSSTPPSRRPSSSSSSSSSSSRSSLRTKEGKVSVAEQISLKNVRSKDNNLKEELEDVDLPFHQLLKPPAGFILDEEGKVVLMAPDGKRVVSMVEKETGRSLECLIRRAFSSSQGRQCFILLPLDTPLQILRIEEKMRSLSELTEPELEEVLPTAAYALAKKRMHLVVSGFCLTARGGFCFTEDEVMDLETEYSEGLTGSLAEGVEITNFQVGYNNYLIYTPFDPVMFVAMKDEDTGDISIADDNLMEDCAVLDAIDEENEFQEMVEEEEAINQTLKESRESSG